MVWPHCRFAEDLFGGCVPVDAVVNCCCQRPAPCPSVGSVCGLTRRSTIKSSTDMTPQPAPANIYQSRASQRALKLDRLQTQVLKLAANATWWGLFGGGNRLWAPCLSQAGTTSLGIRRLHEPKRRTRSEKISRGLLCSDWLWMVWCQEGGRALCARSTMRWRKVTICARVTVPSGANRLWPTPEVIP